MNMKINRIQENELNEARDIQKRCLDLHLPTPPVVLWDATILDSDGNEKERTISKANSYVRNALNTLARFVGMTASSIITTTDYKDGLINLKSITGTITTSNSASPTFTLRLGDSTSPTEETLNHFTDITLSGSWNNGGYLHYTNFDENSRKLITQFVIIMVNNSLNTQYISEAGVLMFASTNLAPGNTFLMLRDVFTPIAVGAGESIRFVYQTEVLYPL